MAKNDILNEVVTGYRKLIDKRYQYENLKGKLPPAFDKDFIAHVRNYFLDYIYPDIKKREELNDAFESLNDYIKQPEKLLSILIDSGSLIFKYGRHLPKILTAGLKALKSFTTVNQFEEKLVEAAIKNEVPPPFDIEDINSLIRFIDREDIDSFISSCQSLFEVLHDRILVQKILEIVTHLITKMEKRKDVYSEQEIKGLEIGKELIKKGETLFNQLDNKNDRQQLIQFIIDIEREAIDSLFG